MKLTTTQVADKLNVSTTTVRQWVKTKGLPGVPTNPNSKKLHYAFDDKELKIWRAAHNGSLPTSPKKYNRGKVEGVGLLSKLLSKIDSDSESSNSKVLKKIEAKLDHLIKIWS